MVQEQDPDTLENFWIFLDNYVKINKITPTFLYKRGAFTALDEVLAFEPNPDCERLRREGRLPPVDEDQVRPFGDSTQPYNWSCVSNQLAYLPTFYNNFEVMDLNIIRNEDYKNFLQAVDLNGGFYFHRWGDAIIRFVGLALTLPLEDVLYVTDSGFKHGKK
eukprot:TRINITY_DN28642_c0_g1_i1.p1 TRINITY_DN28642_c0_g1~~TRINITY_DN28642_c0_g1_i1.p1  ORF type:complete len:162 (-),score=35.00 TRINITY_DN28642_c0_g1_i1:95-580(-)